MVARSQPKTSDLAIIGGGILGVSLAYWLSSLYQGRFVLIEKEAQVGLHTTSRNTGVLHRPFYLHPVKKKLFARSALLSYPLWKKYCRVKKLPWVKVGTLEVALDKKQFPVIKNYQQWALKNGLKAHEIEVLNSRAVKKLEPHVCCAGAFFCPTDISTDFGLLTKSLKDEAQKNGVQFLMSTKIKALRIKHHELELLGDHHFRLKTKFLVNCAGGAAVKIAHLLGVAQNLTDLNFRGEYWLIDPRQSHLARHNIYSVPRHKEFPFLDPHWIVRWNGQVEIGPTAVPVAGPYVYQGFFQNPFRLFQKLFEKPIKNKLKLLFNPEFLQLALEEWKSALSKKVILERAKRFLPPLKLNYLIRPGSAGIRSQVIDEHGHFAKEALEFFGPHSFHILNFNSPGATGAPAYTAYLLEKLRKKGCLNYFKRPKQLNPLWSFENIIQSFKV